MMKGTKRPSTSPNDDPEKKKKLQIRLNERTSLTCIEHFSNELFYEIFDYLDGIDIYNTFTDLNYRFHQNQTQRLGIKYKHFLHMNKHQIFSLNLSKSTRHGLFFPDFTITSSFIRLQSLSIEGIQLNLLISLLLKLTRLPCLFSLTINGFNTFSNLTNIYRLIYALPKLKYNKFCYYDDHSFTSLSKAKEKHFSPIEYLILDHPCTFQELFSLISYTPHLHRLIFLHKWFIQDENFNKISSIHLPYLSHLTINSYYGTFDDFQIFISKIHCKLTILNLFIVSSDITFLSGDRWQRFLIQYLPHLVEFSFKYSLSFDDIHENMNFDRNMKNQFNSSFWIQQNWILDVEIELNAIVYSIKPFWKHFNKNLHWFYQQQNYSMELSNKLSKTTRLVIIYELFNDNMYDLLSYIDHIFNITDIYHLEILEDISFTELTEILSVFHQLHSLQLYTFSSKVKISMLNEDILCYITKKQRNSIKQFKLMKLRKIDEMDFLMKLFPRLIYLKINDITHLNVKQFVQHMFNQMNRKSHRYLRSICFRISTMTNDLFEELKQIINQKRIFSCFTIQWRSNEIYIELKE
ncbi:unnamed protein product [Adineta ricciae]|uniref:F-box domain-containing protein n=1 Tax=Adineta ricciae TaxID=249248 RepID=A0A815Q7W8_ADIRI|nr:unnamed protein product [Adineta ricciae]CAF1460132.1 unnamed protein product [Adineta ricciae]